MPFLNLHQDFVFRPDGTLGTDTDGSKDGRFLTAFAPDATAWEDDIVYWTIHDCRPGHVVAPSTGNPGKYAISIAWLRFHIPLGSSPNLVIDSANLLLYWNPDLNKPLGHPDRDANVNRLVPGFIRLGIVPNYPNNHSWGKGPIPSTSQEGNNIWNSIGTDGEGIDWDDNTTCCEFGDNIGANLSIDFGAQLQSVIMDAPNHVPDDVVTLFLHINVDRTRLDMIREWHFRTRSWNQVFNGGDHSTSPRLLIEYHYDTPTPSIFSKSFVHNLIIQHDWDEVTLSECTLDELFLSQDLTVVQHHYRSIEHTILFEQDYALGKAENITVTHVIPFSQDIGGWRDRYESIEDTVVLDHFWTASSELNQSIEHQIIWVQTISVAHSRSAEFVHDLFFTHTPDYSELHSSDVLHTLELSHFFSYEPIVEAKNVRHDLAIDHDIGINFSLNLFVEHTVTFVQVLVGLHCTDGDPASTACNRLELLYAPTIGSVPDKPTIVQTSTIQLDFPTTSPTHSVTLPAPLHGDTEELQVTRIQRKTRGGDLKVFADPSWPTYELRKYSFTGLTDTQRDDLFSFMGASLGQLVRLQDHEGRTWDGVLVNPNGDFAQVYVQCGHTSEFWFQPVSEVV